MFRIFPKRNRYIPINMVHINDPHGDVGNLECFKTFMDNFKKSHRGEIILPIAGGDINLSTEQELLLFTFKVLKKIKLLVSTLGNHDLELGNELTRILKKAKSKLKFISANLEFSKPNNLEGKIPKSVIIKRKGLKFAFIGASPIDYGDATFINSSNDFVRVKDKGKTVKLLQDEALLLRKQGVDITTLLAHTGQTSKNGDEYYKEFADMCDVDVIGGGHDHLEVNEWLISAKTGKPVKVFSAGKAKDKDIKGENLDSFVIFRAIYDKKEGVLVPEKCETKMEITKNYPKSKKIVRLENKCLKNNKIIGHAPNGVLCGNSLTEESPVGSLTTDAMLWLVNRETKGEKAQIALINGGSIRANFPKDISIGSVRNSLPFSQKILIKTTLTKGKIMDTLDYCVESATYPKPCPGFMHGNLDITIGNDNKIKEAYILDNKGNRIERIDDKPDDKSYTVIYDNFLQTGVAGLEHLRKDPKDPTVEYFHLYNHQKAVIEYITEQFHNKAIDIKTGRIKFEEEINPQIRKELIKA